ncbi:hypothetical protein BV898_05219 [Hypsibius exemplaris]|uniref:Uncharacterized protein n=1 Tax=Hypsibius exemplaris TaxID=2072580 RepID=A0A1W0X076_HYPEX|nr:hypothetical protein BV898_05219 [Hypsibius exemplaris]
MVSENVLCGEHIVLSEQMNCIHKNSMLQSRISELDQENVSLEQSIEQSETKSRDASEADTIRRRDSSKPQSPRGVVPRRSDLVVGKSDGGWKRSERDSTESRKPDADNSRQNQTGRGSPKLPINHSEANLSASAQEEAWA